MEAAGVGVEAVVGEGGSESGFSFSPLMQGASSSSYPYEYEYEYDPEPAARRSSSGCPPGWPSVLPSDEKNDSSELPAIWPRKTPSQLSGCPGLGRSDRHGVLTVLLNLSV